MSKKTKQYTDLENQRYGLFMTENSFDLDVEYGRNYLKTDNVQIVTLYKVDVIKTKSHDLYGQSKAQDKVLMTPIDLNVMVTVEPSEQSYYGGDEGGIARQDTGNLEFGVYLKELEEKDVEILRGDYVGYNMSGQKIRYYEINDAENVVDTTDKTIGGFRPYWRKVTATPVKDDTLKLFEGNRRGK